MEALQGAQYSRAVVVSRLQRAQGPIHGSTRADALREHRCGQHQGEQWFPQHFHRSDARRDACPIARRSNASL